MLGLEQFFGFFPCDLNLVSSFSVESFRRAVVFLVKVKGVDHWIAVKCCKNLNFGRYSLDGQLEIQGGIELCFLLFHCWSNDMRSNLNNLQDEDSGEGRSSLFSGFCSFAFQCASHGFEKQVGAAKTFTHLSNQLRDDKSGYGM